MAAYRLGDHIMLADNFEPQPERASYAVQVQGLHDAHHALRTAIPIRTRGNGVNKLVNANTRHFLLRGRACSLANSVTPEPFPLNTLRTAGAYELRLYACVNEHDDGEGMRRQPWTFWLRILRAVTY